MNALLALAAALSYGVSDFLGGLAGRRLAVATTLLIAQVTAGLLLVVTLGLVPGRPLAADLAWGAVAGLLAATGGALLYGGLARGPMSVVAPLSAVCVAGVPLAAGLALGERPGAEGMAGAALGLAGVVLVSRPPPSRDAARRGRLGVTVAMAFGAGLSFGAFFVVLPHTRPQAGLVPLLVCYTVSALAFAAVRLRPWLARELREQPAAAGFAVAAGALEALAHCCYLFATRSGLLSIAAVLTALYPAATVLLARFVLAERFSRMQRIGLPVVAVALCLLGWASPADG
ncbi:EamA family transporter [Nonomuraea sp. NPDC005692]|uniref:EamA family transporter n=1 Tax=Nonomuraea sp. NPDC005692 TaxID=3157168 RepID=UPI0033E453E5